MDKFYLDREETLLLVIDIQEKLLPVISNKEDLVEKNNILISTAKKLNIPIIYTEHYAKGIGPTVEKLKENLEGATKFDKKAFSACIEEGFLELISETKRKKIIVTGTETHVCVFQTIRDLLKNGYTVHVPFDAVGSRVEEVKNNALELLRDMGAVITNTELVVFDLVKISGTPEFKEILKLVK
ncbi:MAG TPA: isochorismatase family protein [Tissierellia bacterium]|nr:isochorismatase family protein [Tissierellia bacterium]